MRSPTSSEDSRLVRLVPCAQTRLPGHRGHRDAFSKVQKTHYWSELLCRVHKRGCQGIGAIEMHSRKFRRLTIGQNCCAVCTNEVARA